MNVKKMLIKFVIVKIECIFGETKRVIMNIYILKEEARTVQIFEDYDYALVIKAKMQQANPKVKYHIEEHDVTMGAVSAQQVDLETVKIVDEDSRAVAVIDVTAELEHYEVPVGTDFSDRILYNTECKWELSDTKVFGESIEALGLTDPFYREVANEVNNCIEELNENLD